MVSALTTRQKETLRRSSREKLEDVFEHLRRHFRFQRWIANSNRYRRNTVKTLKRDTDTGGSLAHGHLAQYIAASVPLHCLDGWSYLGRALHCHIRGDADAARHLAYYAELRAAMSLLASEGVGIFWNRHFVVDRAGTCRLVTKAQGTHRFSWLSLEHWADRRPSAVLLGTVVSPAGVPLHVWLDGFQAGTFYAIGREWLKAWGIDLRRLVDDHDARNEASYRPTRIGSPGPIDAATCSEFLRNLWAAFEPSAPSRFETLDRYLLRESLDRAFQGRHDKKPADDPAGFRASVQSMVTRVGLAESIEAQWTDFLTRATEPNTPHIISEASGNLRVGEPGHHLQVMARAALLLRVATGASAQLVREAGYTTEDLEFWWKPLGEDRGFWSPGIEPDDLVDLWADVANAVGDLQVWETGNAGGASSFHDLWIEQSPAVSVLEGSERIGLWGLGL